MHCHYVLVLVLWTSSLSHGSHGLYEDLDLKTLTDARYQVPHCTLQGLLGDATRWFDRQRGMLYTPDPWRSRTCHIPTELLLHSNAWDDMCNALERALFERYRDPILIPTCCSGGVYWPAYGGLADFACHWKLPYAWIWNHTAEKYWSCLYRKYDNVATRALCGY